MTYMKYQDAALYHGRSHHAKAEKITIEATLLSETRRAYLIDSGEVDKKGKAIGQWIPKSVSEYDKTSGTIQIEDWFAKKEGLV